MSPTAWLALAAFVTALTLYSADADGAMAVWDGAWYGHFAQWYPAGSIIGHHPLFHAIVLGVTWVLQAAGIAGPGHVAVRIVAGAGGALVLLLIARLAGPKRLWVGAAFALVLFATRGFIAEVACGENLFPAFAAALVLFECATSSEPSLRKIWLALVLAISLRQDNLLLLPGVLIAVAPALPRGDRLKRLSFMVVSAGVVVFILYVLAWIWARTQVDENLFDYLTRFGRIARWMPPTSPEANLTIHGASFGVALVGQHWLAATPHILIGAAWVAIVGIAALSLRGTEPSRRYAAAVLTTIVIRAPFFAWFEPQNFEWQVLPIVLLLALGARTARGTPKTAPRTAAIGLVLLAALAAATLAAHAANTWTLRQRRLASAVDQVIEAGGTDAYFIAVNKNAMIALELRRKQYDRLDTPDGAPIEPLAQLGLRRRAELKRPIVIVADRFVGDGMPYGLDHAAEGLKSFDHVESSPGVRVLQWEGKNFAAVLPLP